jgi:hypothetical protein
VLLPRLHVAAVVLHRRRRRDRVAPRRAEPFDRAPVPRVLGDHAEGVDHVVQPRLAKPVQQRARVVCPLPTPTTTTSTTTTTSIQQCEAIGDHRVDAERVIKAIAPVDTCPNGCPPQCPPGYLGCETA